MNRFARASLVIVAGAGLSLTTSPALAHDDDPDLPEGSGDWAPMAEVDPAFYDPIDIEACGTTVTMSPGDERDVETRQTDLPNGDLLIELRGAFTVDLTRHDTGQVIDELDISGDTTELISEEGTHIIGVYEGPSILFPFPELGPVDAAAFEAAGIPDLAYFKKGVVTFDLVINPETGEAVSEEADVDARLHDLCTWFDGNRGHGNDKKDWKGHS